MVECSLRTIFHAPTWIIKPLGEIGKKLLIVTVLGLILRYILGTLYTYPFDINYWTLVTQNFILNEGLYGLPGYYYSPVWGYILSIFSSFVAFVGMPIGEYVPELISSGMFLDWKAIMPSLSYTISIKTVLFIADLLVAWTLFLIGKEIYDERRAFLMFTIWFLCPLTIVISSVRVMFDNIEILFILLSLYCMIIKKPELAGVMMGLSLLTKPYGVFLGIMLIGYSYAQSGSIRYSLKYVISTIVTGLVMMVPVFITGDFEESLLWLTSRSEGSGSGYNYSLILVPLLLIGSIMASAIIARYRLTAVEILTGCSLLFVGGMLLIAGNVQYYLVLLPFLLLLSTKLFYVALSFFIALGICAFIGFSEWNSYLYIYNDLWGADVLQQITDALYRIDQNLNYDILKTSTAAFMMAVPIVQFLMNRRCYDQS